MSNEAILCDGNALAERLSEISSRGGRVEVMDTGVRGNAGYRLHVHFERVAELAPPVAVRQVVDGTYCQQVNNPAALASIPTGDILPQVKGGGLNADQQPLQSVPRACSVEERLAALHHKLSASGQLGAPRFKSRKEARLPHPND